MNPAKLLFELQTIDTDIDEHRASLEDVESRLGESEELRLIRAELAQENERLSTLEKEQHQLEWEADDLGVRIKEIEGRLYDGSVRLPKELGNLQEEVDHLKKRRDQLDSRALEIMGEVDSGKIAWQARDTELDQSQGEWDAEQAGLGQERERLLADIQDLDNVREKTKSQIDPRGLRIYEGLRTSKGGKATVLVGQGRCQGCRLGLPSHTLRLVESGQRLVHCNSCGRILYSEV